MGRFQTLLHTLLWLNAGIAIVGCRDHPSTAVDTTALLNRASAACLARVLRLDDRDERPSCGDHYVEVHLLPVESSGEIPSTLRLVIEPGSVEVPHDARDQVDLNPLRHDSLRPGELHWFVFSSDHAPAKLPLRVAGWWPWKTGTVPQNVVTAVKSDRFSD